MKFILLLLITIFLLSSLFPLLQAGLYIVEVGMANASEDPLGWGMASGYDDDVHHGQVHQDGVNCVLKRFLK